MKNLDKAIRMLDANGISKLKENIQKEIDKTKDRRAFSAEDRLDTLKRIVEMLRSKRGSIFNGVNFGAKEDVREIDILVSDYGQIARRQQIEVDLIKMDMKEFESLVNDLSNRNMKSTEAANILRNKKLKLADLSKTDKERLRKLVKEKLGLFLEI